MLQTSGWESFCYPKALLPSMDTATWYQRTIAVFSLAIVLLLIVLVILVVGYLRKGSGIYQYKVVKTSEES